MRLHENCAKGFGTFENQIPMPIKRRVEWIDSCIADLVAALNAANIVTTASCCGHGKIEGNIELMDGRILTISRSNDEN